MNNLQCHHQRKTKGTKPNFLCSLGTRAMIFLFRGQHEHLSIVQESIVHFHHSYINNRVKELSTQCNDFGSFYDINYFVCHSMQIELNHYVFLKETCHLLEREKKENK